MEEVLRESSLTSIAISLNKISNLPVFILNKDLNLLAISGVSEQEGQFFKEKCKLFTKFKVFQGEKDAIFGLPVGLENYDYLRQHAGTVKYTICPAAHEVIF
ncbi:hypothetical protein [Bacillus sp. EB600]|uniref:hypothetical protein n=1 Tax=Bacillus sp. EB600 TaxID=2806345 RepID=UPI002109235F|nr:hypothetical protein [Bacillus sp. EB600]MCQ6279944.1 hypothetical protein [Bacillus sp. EB600]